MLLHAFAYCFAYCSAVFEVIKMEKKTKKQRNVAYYL
jgi:hypothetical protein